ncbi:MAG TPA: ArsC family (seleno)protein, partial [Candidatus Eisenbacteria bacterium]|nr:ArsC family (seleno)protein [Candidatus Eisenbacteria bacterium]
MSVTEQADAKKATIKGAAALDVLDGVDELYVAKGKKVEHVDLRKAKPDRAALLALLLGPTGNLRAPTLRKGRTLIVGFEGLRAYLRRARHAPDRPPAASRPLAAGETVPAQGVVVSAFGGPEV